MQPYVKNYYPRIILRAQYASAAPSAKKKKNPPRKEGRWYGVRDGEPHDAKIPSVWIVGHLARHA